jgi:hypothetical protein
MTAEIDKMRRKRVSRVMNLAGLEDKNISQINATIIAGALVFLTISWSSSRAWTNTE